jgi:hypothetical protein
MIRLFTLFLLSTIILETLLCADLYVSNSDQPSADCLSVSTPCKSMFEVSKAIVDQANNIYLLENAQLDGECVSNYSLTWVNANCQNNNALINSKTFCLKSKVSLIMAGIDVDLTEFSLEKPFISAIGKLELYNVHITGGQKIRAFSDSIIVVFLATSVTLSTCQFSNMYCYCNTQIIYFSMLCLACLFILLTCYYYYYYYYYYYRNYYY